MSASGLKAGFAQRTLPVPVGRPMDGYVARTGVAEGIADPLQVGGVAWTAGDTTVVHLVFDLLGLSGRWVEELRAAVAETAKVPPGDIIASATHTHSGPAGIAGYPEGGESEREVARTIIRVATETVQEALALQRPVTVTAIQRPLEGVSSNRVEPSAPVDDLLSVLVAREPVGGRPVGIVANFACHPTILPAANLRYSGDLFGYAARAVGRATGVPCLLTNGAEGDVSTRFTRREQSLDEVARLGGALAKGIEDLLEESSWSPEFPSNLALRRLRVPLPMRPAPDPRLAAELLRSAEEALAEAVRKGESPGRLRQLQTRVEGASLLLQRSRQHEPGGGTEPATVELTGLRIGDVRMVGVPGELFSETVLRLRQRARIPAPWFVLGLTDGYEGYFPSPSAYRCETYEALRSPYGPEVSLRLEKGIADLLTRL